MVTVAQGVELVRGRTTVTMTGMGRETNALTYSDTETETAAASAKLTAYSTRKEDR
jgi:nanoRNase/pAp phosphatase (c-di-AMP/oligoRNAs hydrolase)